MNDSRYRLPAEFDRLQAPSSAYAPRQVVTYLCTREHLVSVPFAADAEVPETWDCRCGKPATRVDPASADPAPPADSARAEAGEPTAPAS